MERKSRGLEGLHIINSSWLAAHLLQQQLRDLLCSGYLGEREPRRCEWCLPHSTFPKQKAEVGFTAPEMQVLLGVVQVCWCHLGQWVVALRGQHSPHPWLPRAAGWLLAEQSHPVALGGRQAGAGVR